MGREVNRLTAVKVTRLAARGLYHDGQGLYLRVSPTGARSWIFRYTLHGRTSDLGLGPLSAVTLAEARQRAHELRRLRYAGADPRAHQRRPAPAAGVSFSECCERYIEIHGQNWGAKHLDAWRSTLRQVFPVLGDRAVAEITADNVIEALAPLWKSKRETAGRVRGRIEAVLDYAKAAGLREGENVARWKGHLAHLLPAKPSEKLHFRALPYRDVPKFMEKLRRTNVIGARCLEFIILTAARLAEGQGALWSEVDMTTGIWTVPAARMKAGRSHQVPLSTDVLALLREQAKLRRGDLVFAGMREGRPVSSAGLLNLVRQVAGDNVTIHGFRSAFRTWVAEKTDHPRELAEAALAHVSGDEVERAYQRGDMIDKRRRLMDAWADYCAKPAAGAAVTPIRGVR
jgi:integrase